MMQLEPAVIRRYGRYRLYDPARGRYVLLEELRAWEVKSTPFVVVDAETGEDVTRALLG